jgi:hypothetical protein
VPTKAITTSSAAARAAGTSKREGSTPLGTTWMRPAAGEAGEVRRHRRRDGQQDRRRREGPRGDLLGEGAVVEGPMLGLLLDRGALTSSRPGTPRRAGERHPRGAHSA